MTVQKNHIIPGMLLLLLLSGLCLANTPKATILGPRLFVRGVGRPVAEQVVFEVPHVGLATLLIANGAEDDYTTGERVSSAVVSLNGITVVGPESFNQKVDGIQIPIELHSGTNVLSVELQSKPGGSISIHILAEVDSIEMAPISEPVEIGGNPLICEATVTALGIPAFGIDVRFEVGGFEGIPPVTGQTDLSGVVHATFAGFTETGMGVVAATVVESDPPLSDSEEFEVLHTQIGPQGGTIEGPDGVFVTFPAGAVDEYIPVSIEPLGEEQLGKDTPPGYVFLGAAYFDIEGVILNENADITVPCPSGVPADAEIYVAQVIEYAGVPMFLMVDTASVQGDLITSEAPGFPGIIVTGTYCFLWADNVGWVGGQVTYESGGGPVPGAVATLSGGYFLDIADGSGNYMLPAWTGNFVVVAFDEATADHGEKQGYMPSSGASIVCNVQIGGSSGPVQGNLTNGDFETGDLTGWVLSGAGSVIGNLGPITPYEGGYMGMISTGSGAIGGASSGLEQTFTVPSGVTTLTVRYNFVSEEYPEWVGSSYNDVFNATLHTPEGSVEVAFASVNTATWYPVSGINFPGGDNTCGQTGWLEANIDVSQYAGTDDTLTLTVHDVGDTIYDTVVLLDDIKLTDEYPAVEIWDFLVVCKFGIQPSGLQWNNIERNFRRASNFLYDATDGQVRLGTIKLREWNIIDATLADVMLTTANEAYTKMMPWIFGYVVLGIDSEWYHCYSTIVHELGHYKFGLGDEYTAYDFWGHNANDPGYGHLARQCGPLGESRSRTLMELQYHHNLAPFRGTSEFCSPEGPSSTHTPIDLQGTQSNTHQDDSNGESGWTTIHGYNNAIQIPTGDPLAGPCSMSDDPSSVLSHEPLSETEGAAAVVIIDGPL